MMDFCCAACVRLWPKADNRCGAKKCPLLGAQRTFGEYRELPNLFVASWRRSTRPVARVKPINPTPVLGLLWLTLHDERRAWKGFDWDALERLHQKGLIANPANKAKSVVLTDEGLRRAQELFHTLFTRPAP